MVTLRRVENCIVDRLVASILWGLSIVTVVIAIGCTRYPETPEDCFLKQVQPGMSSEAAKLIRSSCEERYRKSALRLDAEQTEKLSATAAVILTNAELHIRNGNDDVDVTEVLLDVQGGLASIRIPVSIAPRGEIRQTAEIDGGAAKRRFDDLPKEPRTVAGVGILPVPYNSTKEDQIRAIIEMHPHYYDRDVRSVTIREAYGVMRR